MQGQQFLQFDRFTLDIADERLWRDAKHVRLTHKAFSLLQCFVQRPGQLVTKDELLATVWPEAVVSESVLANGIRELRRALGDQARSPTFIETVHRRGYRFIAPILSAAPRPLDVAPEQMRPETSSGSVVPRAGHAIELMPKLMVSREAEMEELQQRFARVLGGERQVVFVTGEAGIGKTTLVDAFIAEVTARTSVGWGRGQCMDQFGAGEAYLPLLEALGQLGRSASGARLIEQFEHLAPSWLLQLPALVSPARFEAIQWRASHATRDRMLRELAEAIDTLTVDQPLILILEDLHWGDGATFDWLAYMARRRGLSRLMILSTYRPVEALAHVHPLRAMIQDLQVRCLCTELGLSYLSQSDVTSYVAQRFQGHFLPERFSEVLHQRTHGHPLFLTMIIDDLVRQGAIWERATGWEAAEELLTIAANIPEGLRQLLVQQLTQLEAAERLILEAASVAGVEFTAAAVAAGNDSSVDAIEACCDLLSRRGQFLRELGTAAWPDGELSGRYGFIHAFYHEVFYAQVPSSRRARLHRQIGLQLEKGYGDRTREIAAELAVHFARGGDAQRAVFYLHTAANTAMFRHAHSEAIAYLVQGIALLPSLPEAPELRQQELNMQLTLGASLIATKGYTAPEVGHAYHRAQELCRDIDDKQERFRSLLGLQAYYASRSELATAWSLSQQALHIAQQPSQPPTQRQRVLQALGQLAFHRGVFVEAKRHLERSFDLCIAADHGRRPPLQDPGVVCLTYLSWTSGALGYLTQARQHSHEALARAQALGQPFSLVYAQWCRMMTCQFCREVSATQESADALLSLVAEYDLPFYGMWGRVLRGWSLAMQGQGEEGLPLVEQGLASFDRYGAELGRAMLLILQAEAYGHSGQPEEGLRVLERALERISVSGDCYFETEAHRLKGELLIQAHTAPTTETTGQQTWVPAVEQSFFQALDIARYQHAKTLELRSTVSLSQFWQDRGRGDEARALLTEVYGWFTEGFDTLELQAAKALIDTLN